MTGHGSGILLGVLLLVAGSQYAWNAARVAPFSGYDEGGHVGYVQAIRAEGRLPHPYSGWSTFHPPLYYALGAVVWNALEPLGPRWVMAGLRAISCAAVLGIGAVSFALARARAPAAVALVAGALALFVPSVQMSAVMVGNEALAACFAALALPPVLRLQRDPGDVRNAALAGLAAGLALATKASALLVLPACAVPFLRRLDGRSARALAACALAIALIAGPLYGRNVALTGTPLPMTRQLEPMKSVEAKMLFGERRLQDYLSLPLESLAHPSLVYVELRKDSVLVRVNRAMHSVWGLLYASTWYDPFAVRIDRSLQMNGAPGGRMICALGLVPTAAVLAGLLLALRDAFWRRGRSDDAPLVAMMLGGIASFVAFTWSVPSVAAVKASYLLPLVAPAAAFFATALARLPWPLRHAAVAVSVLAVVVAAALFTTDVVFPPQHAQGIAAFWRTQGALLPTPYVLQALDALGPPHP